MIHIKDIKTSVYIKLIIVLSAIVTVFLLTSFLPLEEGVHALSNTGLEDDIFYTIMNNSMPILDVSMGEDGGEETTRNIAYTLFKSITNINLEELNNPQAYLESEIPLLGLFDVVTFSGIVSGSSSSKGISQSNIPVDPNATGNGNFQEVPVSRPNIDYSKPAVIIFHTHTTESYTPSPKYSFEIIGDYQSTDNSYNVCRLGQEIKSYLETNYGIAVIHDTTMHDMPSRTGSYERAKPTLENLLKRYPDVKMIIDLHRDGVPEEDKPTVTANINGEQAAKIMFCIGKSNPHWQENYYLASMLDQKMEELYKGISKGNGFYFGNNLIYNQDISNKALLIEIGAQCSTLDEALASSRMLAKSIGELLKAE